MNVWEEMKWRTALLVFPAVEWTGLAPDLRKLKVSEGKLCTEAKPWAGGPAASRGLLKPYP